MAERKRIMVEPPARMPAKASVKFVTSGSIALDLILGGGYAQGRIVNIVGDKSAGKTLLAIEACANFAKLYGADSVRYCEAEDAFDEEYAAMIGMPADIELAEDIETVEGFIADLKEWLQGCNSSKPCLYVLDSLDALSCEVEVKREYGEATYGQEKAKLLSEFFRKENHLISKSNCTLIVISQVRDNIGVTFGEKHKRSGGKALDFYCSQVMWLAHTQQLKRTVKGVERVVGAKIEAKMKKMKVGPPFRSIELTVIFSYGVDDETSMLNWLHKYKVPGYASPAQAKEISGAIEAERAAGNRGALKKLHAQLKDAIVDRWMDIEAALAPTISKYGE